MEDHGRDMEDQDEWCNLIALSVGTVMRQSLDNNFKEELKKLVGATSTNMVEELLYKRLKKKLQTGSHSSIQQPLTPINPSTSVAVQEEPPSSQSASSTIVTSTTATSTTATSTTVTSTTVASTTMERNLQLSKLYHRTIQKRCRSPQPGVEPDFKLRLQKGLQNSAPF